MKLYEYTPQKNTKKLAIITGSLLCGAGILMLMNMFLPRITAPWMFQLLAVGMLMMVVFITSRYIMKSYVYAIIEEDGDTDLTVTEIQGRHVITVCRLSLSRLEAVVIVPKGDRMSETPVKEKIQKDKRKSYNYCSDFFDEKYICLFSNEGGTPVAVKLSWDKTLEDMLAQHLNEDAEYTKNDTEK